MTGKVYLIGAGPGDPDLLTVKAARLLRTADAVLHDDLVSPEILQLIPKTAQIHNVGKRCGKKKISQQEINFLMVELAASGLQVVRLKSGDPLIFGRAAEEIDALRKADLPYEIVSGVTSALGAAATAQIPLTDRRSASALVFLTAHHAPENDHTDWTKFAGSGVTLVIYMPGTDYASVAKKLTAAGFSGKTPCALISRATTCRQQTCVTTISALRRTPAQPAPTLLVVGEVVRLAAVAQEPFLGEVRDFTLSSIQVENLALQAPHLRERQEELL